MAAINEKSRMVDDSQAGTEFAAETYGPELLSEMAQMAEYKIARSRSVAWAQDLLCIVHDDSGDQEEDENDSEASKDKGTSKNGATEPVIKTVRDHECDHCRPLPLFPKGRPRRFRLARSRCTHFLAVSYCWPKDKHGNPKPTPQTYTYRIGREDGTAEERELRPPDEVVNRAIAYAQLHCLRQIWIDQVCLPQDDSEEQQVGVQGIDLVYQRAHVSIGLFESVIHEQGQLDAFMAVIRWARTGDFQQEDRTATLLMELLQALGGDQWNTRAWILQEAFAASNKMMILVPLAMNVRFNDDHGMFSVPQHLPGFLMFLLDDLPRIIAICHSFLDFISSTVAQIGHEWLANRLNQQAAEALTSLQQIRPPSTKAASSLMGCVMVGGRQFGSRETCNAAVALTYLRGRRSYPPSDRLAILANLCDFEVRLDTRQVRRFRSLSTAYVTLALMNGDFSLLNQDLYQTVVTRAPMHTHLWCPPFKTILPNIDSRTLRPGTLLCPRLPRIYHILKEGLKCPAVIWNVNERIDLTQVRQRWEPTWREFLVLDLTVLRRDDDTQEGYRSRVEAVNEYVGQNHGKVYEGTTDPFLSQNTSIKWQFSLNYVQNKQEVTNTLGAIFIDVFRTLYANGHTSLANSIWQSIRAAVLPKERGESNTEQELPDDIEDLLESSTLLQDPFQLIRLDWADMGSFWQVWILNRIMRDGFILAGRGSVSSESDKSSEPYHTASKATRKNSSNSPDSTTASDGSAGSMLHRAMRRQMMTSMVRAVADHDDGKASLGLAASAGFTEFAMALTPGYTWDDHVRQQMVTFDVDGPALVATPLDRDLERLPHPPDRSMRVSWVVEPQPKPGLGPYDRIGSIDRADRRDETDSYLHASSAGGSETTKQPDPPNPRSSQSPSETADSSRRDPYLSEEWVFNKDRYKVQSSVKGFWPLIENMPRYSYLFV